MSVFQPDHTDLDIWIWPLTSTAISLNYCWIKLPPHDLLEIYIIYIVYIFKIHTHYIYIMYLYHKCVSCLNGPDYVKSLATGDTRGCELPKWFLKTSSEKIWYRYSIWLNTLNKFFTLTRVNQSKIMLSGYDRNPVDTNSHQLWLHLLGQHQAKPVNTQAWNEKRLRSPCPRSRKWCQVSLTIWSLEDCANSALGPQQWLFGHHKMD